MNLVLGIWMLVVIVITSWCWWKKKREKGLFFKKMKTSSKGKLPRGNSGWPYVGETLHFIASGCSSQPLSFMDKRKSMYGKVFKSHLLGIPIIVSTDPEVNKVVLQNNGSTFIPYYPKSITELLGKSSILQMNGGLHKRVHGLIGGFLKSPQLKARITKEIEMCVKISMEDWKDKELIYMQEETSNITFQVLVKVLMGINPGKDLDFLKREFGEFIKGLVCLPIKFPGTRLYKSLKAKKQLLKMVKRIVEEKKMKIERMKNEGGVHDVMDAVEVLLSDVGESLPSDFISGNIIEMMIPGEESVPMLMTLAIKYLTDCPPAAKQLMEENMELKRQKTDSNQEYVWTDYMSLPFTQNVISETLRMANIVNGVWRKALKDVEIKGYLIPKGWCTLASFSSVHMNEENYKNAYEFDPWRWQVLTFILINSYYFAFAFRQKYAFQFFDPHMRTVFESVDPVFKVYETESLKRHDVKQFIKELLELQHPLPPFWGESTKNFLLFVKLFHLFNENLGQKPKVKLLNNCSMLKKIWEKNHRDKEIVGLR